MRGSLLVAVLAAMLAPVRAWAGPRTPMTTGVYLRAGDPHALYVRTTFGLLISHDDGCSFRWVCEQAIGTGGGFDPRYAIAADGTIYAATFSGLRISRDGGCTWETGAAAARGHDPADLAEAWIDAIDLAPDGHVWIATAESAKPNNLYESADGGATFEPRGMFSQTVWYKSIEVARSEPRRIYATGYQVAGEARAHLYRSDDAGKTWSELPLGPVVRYGATPIVHVLAVDPRDADVLYLRSAGARPPSGDRLYRSRDGGHTFAEVLASTDAVHDVVIRAHDVLVATASGGTFAAADGIAFTPMAGAPQLACLAERADGSLVGCGSNWAPDEMALATSATGATWQKLFRFGELAGPLACPAGSAEHDACAPQWAALQQQLGAKPKVGCPVIPEPPRAPPRKSGGCCDAGEPTPGGALVVGVAAVLLGARRRRRAR